MGSIALFIIPPNCSYGFEDDQEEDATTPVLNKIQTESHRLEWVKTFACLTDIALLPEDCSSILRVGFVTCFCILSEALVQMCKSVYYMKTN